LRLLLVFFATVVLGLVGIMALNWWVDPFGQFWKPGAVTEALDSPGCLISGDLFRGAPLRLKLHLARDRPTRTIVLGTSRVLSIDPWPGERTFTNLGILDAHASDALWLVRRLPARPRLTVYLGVEEFWFNPSSGHHDFAPGFRDDLDYVLSWSALQQTINVLKKEPDALIDRWTRATVGGHCVVGHGLAADDAWRPDGTIVWPSQLSKDGEPFQVLSAQDLETGFFGGYSSFAPGPLRDLTELLALAKQRRWTVVGFSPPYPASYVDAFLRDPQLGQRWRRFGQVIPALFRRYGYPWLNLRDASSVPCDDGDYLDGGFHFDAQCSRRIRVKLDAAAKRYRQSH
jgi:hypothetical protein